MVDSRIERYLMIVTLTVVVLLTVYIMVVQLARDAYDAGVRERATLSVQASQVASTLTAVK